MQERQEVLDGIPVRLYDPGSASGLLLLGHGGGHSKDGERFVRLSRLYAHELGLAVACIDAVDHGERRQAQGGDGVPPGWHSHAIPQMVTDWQRVTSELDSLGPAIAYVGFSMGAIFGMATVASIPSISAAVFVAGGIPTGGWVNDPALEPMLLGAAGQLGGAHVLLLNKDDDDLFGADEVRRLFASVSAKSKSLRFFPGPHDEWQPELIDESLRFLSDKVG